MPPRLLVIDNFDSFTYNLVQYFGELGASLEVHRANAIDADAIAAKRPDALVFSPGPGHPREATLTLQCLQRFAGEMPMLGVCLGQQALGEAFGGRVIRAERIMHGKTSPVRHNGQDLFAGLPDPMVVCRYHSLLVERETLPECLEVTAWTDEGEIMGLRHREHPIHGVQFHPESILTDDGLAMLGNFLNMLGARAC